MEVVILKKRIMVLQQKYIIDLLKETGMVGRRLADNLVNPHAKLCGEGSVTLDTGRYQRLVGKLIYFSHARPDIALSILCLPFVTSRQHIADILTKTLA